MPDAVAITEVGERALIRLSSWEPKSTVPSLVPPGLGGEVRVLPLGPTEWWVVSSRFPAGRCTRTRLAQLAVVVDCIDPAPRFELYFGRSYLKYLHAWLVDAVT
jgi:sarcosine oxidase gamma subunit